MGGDEEGENDLEEIELRLQEEEARNNEGSEEENGPGPPLECNFFSFLLFFFMSYLLVQGMRVEVGDTPP